jgi:hypothetical protein
MWIPLDKLSPSSRIWIYQADRLLNNDEVSFIVEQSKNFIESWTAHQADLKGSAAILHHLFLVIAVDESHNDASGCSIDKKVHFVQRMGTEKGIDFFNRLLLAFEGGRLIRLSELNQALANGDISLDSKFYNNMIGTLAELNANWLIPVKSSWLSGFIDPVNA